MRQSKPKWLQIWTPDENLNMLSSSIKCIGHAQITGVADMSSDFCVLLKEAREAKAALRGAGGDLGTVSHLLGVDIDKNTTTSMPS